MTRARAHAPTPRPHANACTPAQALEELRKQKLEKEKRDLEHLQELEKLQREKERLDKREKDAQSQVRGGGGGSLPHGERWALALVGRASTVSFFFVLRDGLLLPCARSPAPACACLV